MSKSLKICRDTSGGAFKNPAACLLPRRSKWHLKPYVRMLPAGLKVRIKRAEQDQKTGESEGWPGEDC